VQDGTTLQAAMNLLQHKRDLRCEKCWRVWLWDSDERWRAYLVHDGPDEKLLFYCPDCAERELGDD